MLKRKYYEMVRPIQNYQVDEIKKNKLIFDVSV
jgi:hypothetical protein